MGRMIFLIFALALGFWFDQPVTLKKGKEIYTHVHPEKEFAVSEHKSFVIVVYASNEALWCERALASIFEQDYDHYRVIVVDDASTDQTHEIAKEFVLQNNQDEKVILIRNEERLGSIGCLYRALDSCLEKEIVIPLEAKDWLSSPLALKRLNIAYQNPDVWLTFGKTIHYPSYEIKNDPRASFYAGLFKELRLKDLFQKGRFAQHIDAYQHPLIDLSGGRIKKIEDPITFSNDAVPLKRIASPKEIAGYQALSALPVNKGLTHADIVVFSFDRPMQLYACLESIQRYIAGFENFTVLYRASNASFLEGYEKVIGAFPKVRLIRQSTKSAGDDFKPKLINILSESASEYVLFSPDDVVVKDFVDLKYCMNQMEKTGAYGFYLELGQHISHSGRLNAPQQVPKSHLLSSGIYAWNFRLGECDWGVPNTLDMVLFKKERVHKPFSELKYTTPSGLKRAWAIPNNEIGLYFARSKTVNIPINVVRQTDESHMNYLDTEELLAKFNQGLKIDIEPLYQMENNSPHIDYIPEFVLR